MFSLNSMFALNMIAEQFNLAEITWAIGGSNVLKRFDLVDHVNDIDLLVMEKDIQKAAKILSELGTKLASKTTKQFETKYFYQYTVHDMQIDLICDFKIRYQDTLYHYIFDEESITDIDTIAGVRIFFTCLEDWYILYRLMNRQDDQKIFNLEKYFRLHGIKHLKLLNRALKEVPKELKFKIKYQLAI